MKYIEKYDLYIDEDLVVYKTYTNSNCRGKNLPTCYLVQIPWQKLKNGYMYHRHYVNGKKVSVYLHRLLAEVFIPNPDNKPTVNHINHKRGDNRLENLEWMTQKEQLAFKRLEDTPERIKKREAQLRWYHKRKELKKAA